MKRMLRGIAVLMILLASHNQSDVDELCDTVCEMEAGVLTLIR